MRRRRAIPWTLSALAALASPLKTFAVGATTPTRPNLLLVTLDTTRADRLGVAGYAAARTPHLDALARRGVRFTRCDAAAPVTLPSHATILTGLYPFRHGVRDNGIFTLRAEIETLPERLAGAGYDTAAVVSAIVLARRHALDQGFRRYDDDLGAGYALGTEVAERTADATSAAALAALAALRPPWFLWVHYYDPHEEYRPPTRFAAAGGGRDRLYDGEIAFVDEQVGALLAGVPGAETVIAVVGDHGEMLGEHGEASHGLLLYEAARRVPLLLAGPGVPAGRTESCLVRTADVAPTLAALAGLPPGAGIDGAPLLPLGGSCARISYAESFLPFYAYKWFPLRALSDGRALYLHAPRPALHRLDLARGEERDLAGDEPETARFWAARLRALVEAAGESLDRAATPSDALSAEQRLALASLGYLAGGGGAAAVAAELPDPREKVGLAAALHGAAEMARGGACERALPELSRITREDPHNFPALSLAGQCLRDAGRTADALALFERAARENPLSAAPVANVAAALLELGRTAEAERELRHALVLDPAQDESATRLARLLRERGERGAAIAVLEGAHAAGARGPALFLERGVARAEGGELAPALADFREAARRAPSDPLPLENAARAAFALGRARESAIFYETLLRLEPERADAWKTLGALYLEALAEPASAARCFREALRLERDPAERARLEAALAAL
jgi:arylsulfatase A-like enzyme/Tfp pilus assembly protein PilF